MHDDVRKGGDVMGFSETSSEPESVPAGNKRMLGDDLRQTVATDASKAITLFQSEPKGSVLSA